MHNEACRRRTNNKARAVIRYIWRDACVALLLILVLLLPGVIT